MDSKQKYLKYKNKYLTLKNNLQNGGGNAVILLDESTVEIDDEIFDDMASWILLSLREVMGFSDVRRHVINNMVDEFKIPNVAPVIPLINPERKNDDEVFVLCKSIISDEDPTHSIFIFTGTNLPDKRTKETHYNIFLIDKASKKLIVIDPAAKIVKRKGAIKVTSGIYESYLAKEVVIPFFEANGYDCNFLPLRNPAQTIVSDVFCQTWTLVLLREFLSNVANPVIEIPKEQKNKYEILLGFYKSVISSFPDFASYLNSVYAENISKERIKLTKKWTDDLLKVNASKTFVEHFIVDDFEE